VPSTHCIIRIGYVKNEDKYFNNKFFTGIKDVDFDALILRDDQIFKHIQPLDKESEYKMLRGMERDRRFQEKDHEDLENKKEPLIEVPPLVVSNAGLKEKLMDKFFEGVIKVAEVAKSIRKLTRRDAGAAVTSDPIMSQTHTDSTSSTVPSSPCTSPVEAIVKIPSVTRPVFLGILHCLCFFCDQK
jgi:hypothetical protein